MECMAGTGIYGLYDLCTKWLSRINTSVGDKRYTIVLAPRNPSAFHHSSAGRTWQLSFLFESIRKAFPEPK